MIHIEFKKNEICGHPQTGDLWPCTLVDVYISETDTTQIGYGWFFVEKNDLPILEIKQIVKDKYLAMGFNIIAETKFNH